MLSSAGMAATRSNTRLFLYSFSCSPVAPSFQALSRLLCSSQGKSVSSSMGVVDSDKSSATATSKVEDKKFVREFSVHESVWYGWRWRMPYEFAKVRKEYPEIPAERVDRSVFWGKVQEPKFLGVLKFPVYSVMVKAYYKDHKVIRRTMLVIGRDVKELEAAAERLNPSDPE